MENSHNVKASMLATRYCSAEEDVRENEIQVGVDEAGRGPLFGRVYAAAVVLPQEEGGAFDHRKMKDSKRFHSVKKLKDTAEYIKTHAMAWSVRWESEETIDRVNIRNATHMAMHAAIQDVMAALTERDGVLLVVDGNDFTPLLQPRPDPSGAIVMTQVPHVCVEGGDNKYTMIAAASILAKTARDEYIEALCTTNPGLVSRYDLLKNKGYGAKRHMDGIAEHGITKWHRRSFGICKTAPENQDGLAPEETNLIGQFESK